MRDHRHIIAAGAIHRSDDRRVGSTHDRHNRGFIREQYADSEIMFWPVKFWPAIVGVSSVTLRNWLNKGVISAYEKHGMKVMTKAEMATLKNVVAKWYNTRDMHNAIEPEFKADLRNALSEVRLALDTYRKRMTMTPHQTLLLEPSIKE